MKTKLASCLSELEINFQVIDVLKQMTTQKCIKILRESKITLEAITATKQMNERICHFIK